jgi:branched-chain amino acid transport system permease protein
VQILQTLTLGLLTGAVYALMASGLTLVFGVMRVINLAHGAFAILAAFLAWTLWDGFGLDPLVSIPIIAVVMFGIGWLTYQGTIRFVRGAHISMTVLLTFGIGLVLEGAMGFIWGNRSHYTRTEYSSAGIPVGEGFIPVAQLLSAGVAVVVVVLLYLVLNYTWQGRAIRAASQNDGAAQLVGVSVAKVSAFTFGLGIATLGAGGAMISTIYPFLPGHHDQWIARLLAIVVLGGLGSLQGAMIGALVIGVAENFASTYISAEWPVALPFIIIFLVLLLRPQGLMGARLREDAVA